MSPRAVTKVNAQVAPKYQRSGGRASRLRGEGRMVRRTWPMRRTLRRGESDGTVTRTRRATGEALLAPPRKRRSQVHSITRDPGEVGGRERVTDGSVVAVKRGNARGAKGPYWLAMSPTTEGRDAMITASVRLQDLKRRLYVMVKAGCGGTRWSTARASWSEPESAPRRQVT